MNQQIQEQTNSLPRNIYTKKIKKIYNIYKYSIILIGNPEFFSYNQIFPPPKISKINSQSSFPKLRPETPKLFLRIIIQKY